MADPISPHVRNWYISGIYYPVPKPDSEIPPEEKWRNLTKDQLKDVNSQLVGKPLLIDHPFDANGMPLFHKEFGANYRGKVIESKILDDGRGYFIAKVPVNKNIKTHFFKKDLSRGKYAEFSISHSADENGREVPDHIAILEAGKAHFRGCDMLEILKLPKKRNLQNNGIPRINNYLAEYQKGREKRPLICANSRRMEPNPGQVQDDPAPTGETAKRREILRSLLQNPDFANNPDELLGAFDHAITERDQVKSENERIKKEYETLLLEKRAQEEAVMQKNIDEWKATMKEMVNLPADESIELTPEAKAMAEKQNEEDWAEVYGSQPLAEQDRVATLMNRMGRRIAVCSREGIAKQLERQRHLQEAATSRRGPPPSSYQDRFGSTPKASSPIPPPVGGMLKKDATPPTKSSSFLQSLEDSMQSTRSLNAGSTRNDIFSKLAQIESDMKQQSDSRSAKRQRW